MADNSWDETTPITMTSIALPHALTHAQREYLFGRFTFEPEPLPSDPERIRILDGWVDKNIVSVQLPKIGDGKVRTARVHRLIAKQFAAFWADVEVRGLLAGVLTFDGAFNARYKRGRAKLPDGTPAPASALSAHAWGVAVDLNAPWNPLGSAGAAKGTPGSTHELDAIALKYGFINGRNFHAPYQDAQHFESYRVS